MTAPLSSTPTRVEPPPFGAWLHCRGQGLVLPVEAQLLWVDTSPSMTVLAWRVQAQPDMQGVPVPLAGLERVLVADGLRRPFTTDEVMVWRLTTDPAHVRLISRKQAGEQLRLPVGPLIRLVAEVAALGLAAEWPLLATGRLVFCPTCSKPQRSRLSGCREPACLRAELDAERAIDFPAKED